MRGIFSGVLPLLVAAHFAHHLLTAIPVPLLPMIRSEFGLDYAKSGLVISAFSLAYGIGQVPAGWLADRLGPRLLMTASFCGTALAGLLVGLSNLFYMILICLALMGLLGGGYHPAAPPVVSAAVPPQNRGRALGFHMIGGGASFFLAPITAAVLASLWGWRGAFMALALPTLCYGLLLYRQLGRLRIGSQEATESVFDHPASRRAHTQQLFFFIFLSTFTGALFISVVAFVPLYMVDRFGVGEETGGALIALIYSSGLWVSPVAGYISDRVGKIPVMLCFCFLGGLIVYLLTLVPYGFFSFVILAAIGVVIYVRMPVSESYIITRVHPRRRSTVLGIYYFGSMEGGGVLTPILGLIIDRFGFSFGFAAAGASLVLATLICSFWLWGTD